jgi:hypothetical protein
MTAFLHTASQKKVYRRQMGLTQQKENRPTLANLTIKQLLIHEYCDIINLAPLILLEHIWFMV